MRNLITLFLCLICFAGFAQHITISGHILDANTHKALPQASITVEGRNVGVVSNEDGEFTIKVPQSAEYLQISYLGYKTHNLRIADAQNTNLRILLFPSSIVLRDVTVRKHNHVEEIVAEAIRKIPENYSKVPELYRCFYRESAQKRQHYIYVVEGIVDMFKTPYSRSNSRDKVAIIKGRRLKSANKADTLGLKVAGGPNNAINLDIAKNLYFIFDKDFFEDYYLELDEDVMINDRENYVVNISPAKVHEYALYYGKLYIDQETLAFSRAELQLDMSDASKATNLILMHSPFGVRFRPKELSLQLHYLTKDGVTHLNYIRSDFRFNCDWRKKLLRTSFNATCEMVVTDRTSENIVPISGKESFDDDDKFYDNVQFFMDPEFWEDYNIIEPSESLENAIGKLLKKR